MLACACQTSVLGLFCKACVQLTDLQRVRETASQADFMIMANKVRRVT